MRSRPAESARRERDSEKAQQADWNAGDHALRGRAGDHAPAARGIGQGERRRREDSEDGTQQMHRNSSPG